MKEAEPSLPLHSVSPEQGPASQGDAAGVLWLLLNCPPVLGAGTRLS